MTRVWALFATVALVLACGKREQNKGAGNTITVDESKLKIEVKASDVFTDITLIPLETTNMSLMSGVDKVIPLGDTLFLLDKKGGSIMMFNMDGKFLTRIRRQGRGPGEYITLDDFTITRDRKIIILDGEYGRLVFLDKNGGYISQQNLPISVDALESTNGHMLVLNGSAQEDRIILWDIRKGEVIDSHIKYDSRYSARLIKPLIKYGDHIYFQRDKSSTIYGINGSEIYEKWGVDFGKYNINPDELIEMPGWGYVLSPSMADMDVFTETNEYVVFNFVCDELGEYPYYAFYSKKTGEQKYLDATHYKDDMVFNKYPPDIQTATVDGKFITAIMPLYFMENMAAYSPENMTGEELDKWNSINLKIAKTGPSDNPIIMFVTLKDF